MNPTTDFSRLLTRFFTQRLMQQRQVSPHTVASYRDTFRLLVQYAHRQLHKAPSQLTIDDFDSPFIGAFLAHLETHRHNSARTHNARLAVES